MTSAELLGKLREQADAIRGMGATSLYLFGSASRDEAVERSDVDLFIDYDEARRFSLLDLIGMKQLLEEQISADIDITTRDSLHPRGSNGWDRERHQGKIARRFRT